MKPGTKTLMAIAGLAVLVAMGALTATVSGYPALTSRFPVIADTTYPAATTPSVGSVAPTSKASKFQGGDWAGQ
jgi:hypothetical protein